MSSRATMFLIQQAPSHKPGSMFGRAGSKKRPVTKSMSLLSKEMASLVQTAISRTQPVEAGGPGDAHPVPQTISLKDAGVMNLIDLVDPALLSMTERDIELMFRRGTTYFQALTLFMSGSVVEKNVMWNRLTGKVRERGTVYHEPEVEVLVKGNRAAAGLNCDCSAFNERDACPHAVALMLAWVRKRDTFRTTVQTKGARSREDDIGYDGYGESQLGLQSSFAIQSDRVLGLLDEVAEGLKTSSRRDDLDVIQQVQSMMKSCALAYYSADTTHAHNNAFLPDVLSVTTSVYLGVLGNICRKYSLPFLTVYYKGLLATADRTVEMFLDGAEGAAGAGVRSGIGIDSLLEQATRPPGAGRSAGGENRTSQATAAAGVPADVRRTKETSRSWDSIIDELT